MDVDKKKPIILFDVNGTLCYRTYNKETKERGVVFRPGVLDVIKDLSKEYRLGIVTCMKFSNVKYILYELSPKWKAYFSWVFDATYCLTVPKDDDPYFMVRNIPKITEVLESKLEEIIFVDDNPQKYLEENCDIRVVSTFTEASQNDEEMFRLKNELL